MRKSHLTRVHGLKAEESFKLFTLGGVAPYAGAWIESALSEGKTAKKHCRTLRGCMDWKISWHRIRYQHYRSHLTRVHGLKVLSMPSASPIGIVAPYAGAWIESIIVSIPPIPGEVAPYAGAWIESELSFDLMFGGTGRTLRGCMDWKFLLIVEISQQTSRTLRGCMDWKFFLVRPFNYYIVVAPYAGAWIESFYKHFAVASSKPSHLTRVHGLKVSCNFI